MRIHIIATDSRRRLRAEHELAVDWLLAAMCMQLQCAGFWPSPNR